MFKDDDSIDTVDGVMETATSSKSSELALSDDYLPPSIYILPMTERPFFPPQTLPILMDESPWLDTIEHVGKTQGHLLGLVATKTDTSENLSTSDFYDTGTIVRVHRPVKSESKVQFIAEGIKRIKVDSWITHEPPYYAKVSYPNEPKVKDKNEVKAYAIAIINALKELVPLNPLYSEGLKLFLERFGPNEPSILTDFAASLTTSSKSQLQGVLASLSLRVRMQKVLVLIKKELDVARLQMKIQQRVESTINEQQRKFFLKEQLKVIQHELGIAKDDRTADLERFHERLEKIKPGEAALNRIHEELDKLSILETGSPEYGVTRNYVDILTSLPWGVFSQDQFDLDRAQRILDKQHAGLDDIKQRIIEFLAIASIRGEMSGSILLFVGPPGVGKTSIGQSIAEALGRKFFRFSLGGMRDEAEIKGHRRTYIGAMPGKFIQAIKEVQVSNPVIMLDEIDKVGMSFRGDPASALLEVLDPEQNSDFLDHFLDVRFDLSKALFICTANQLDSIPAPLLDRMEAIHLAGYVSEEKRTIARKHLWPKLLSKAGLSAKKIKLQPKVLELLIDGYAREAGVRGLEKQLNRIIRKAGTALVMGKRPPIVVNESKLQEFLGKPVFVKENITSAVGVVPGLAWTIMGGASLNVEATMVHEQGAGFKQTGQLGDVMRESAEIAYSYVRSHIKHYHKTDFFKRAFIHLHVPEGATPKDGPSAGITMATAILSLAINKKIRRGVAMTGELTLTGQVLPVGGIREKLVAAKRNGIKEVILPARNAADIHLIPDYIKKGLKILFVENFTEVVPKVFKAIK